MQDVVRVACVQAEPVVLDREATIEKLAALTNDAAAAGAHATTASTAIVPPDVTRFVPHTAGGGARFRSMERGRFQFVRWDN